jgi:phosphohistidine phosphatase
VKQLILLRHAEAEPTPPGTSDSDRRLTDRGREEALTCADAIAAAGLKVDEALVSPAQRTRETASIMIRRLGQAIPITQVATLYLAAPDVMRQALQACRAESRTVLLVAHNPGLSELAHELTGGTQAVVLRTAGLCHLTLPQQSWGEIGTVQASGCEILR